MSRTYCSVPVRCASTRLVSSTRSPGPSASPLTVLPERVGQRLHVLAEAEHPVVRALRHALLAVRLVVGNLRGVPAVAPGRGNRAQWANAEGRHPEASQRG